MSNTINGNANLGTPVNVLSLNDITMQFGGVVAVNNLSLEVNKGEIVALIGPNGAGKTTAFNVTTGVYAPSNGSVTYYGETIISNYPQGKMENLYAGENKGKYTQMVRHTPDFITKKGIARTFQNIRLFKELTVFENILIAKHMNIQSNIFAATLTLNRAEEARMRYEVTELLGIFGLYDQRNEVSSSLPYGQQRRLELKQRGRAHPNCDLCHRVAASVANHPLRQ